jgi:hypothetical protein
MPRHFECIYFGKGGSKKKIGRIDELGHGVIAEGERAQIKNKFK